VCACVDKSISKVEATKPAASRGVSAEIYIICQVSGVGFRDVLQQTQMQGFLAPKKIDARLLDPKHVFKSISTVARSSDIFKNDVSECICV
jgi:AdoMet-dependent rRNA methyltransferase SPB1